MNIYGDSYGASSGNQGEIHNTFNFYKTEEGVRIPMQYPLRAKHFIGRQAEIKYILDTLNHGEVVTITGPGGIGKTAVVAEAVHQLAPHNSPAEAYPHGILFHNFYKQEQIDFFYDNIARSYGQEPLPTPKAAAQRVLSQRKPLIILDGAENADNLTALINLCAHCGLIITSRRHEDAEDEYRDLPTLPETDAVPLLQSWAGHYADDQTAVQKICELLDGLPLAERLVGRYLKQRQQQATYYLEWLQTTPLQALDQGKKRDKSIPYLIEHSLEQITTDAQTTLSLMGSMGIAPLRFELFAAVLQGAELQIRNNLGELLNFGLVLTDGQSYQLTHALIHTYAARRLTPSPSLVESLAGYWNQLIETETEKGVEGYLNLHPNQPHILAIVGQCRIQNRWQAVNRIVWSCQSYLDIQGLAHLRTQILTIGIEAATHLNDRYDEGAHLGNLGLAYSDLGQVEKAIEYYHQALAIAQEIGHISSAGIHAWNLGLLFEESDPRKAVELMSIRVTYEQQIGHPAAEAHAQRIASITAKIKE